jgi:2-iminobutanoate/2-iminopropanoate deaminase
MLKHYPSDYEIGGSQTLPFSRAIRAGDFVFLSGITAVDRLGRRPVGAIEVEVQIVLETVKSILEDLDCAMSDVISATCYLDDPRDFVNFNRVYSEYFSTNPPVRTTVRAQLMLDVKVEISIVAYRPIK